jgi:ATP synthase protein I
MMTTESKQVRAGTGAGTLLGAAASALPVGLVVALVGLATDGTPALFAGLAGALATTLVLAGGALAVDAVARIMPSASLLLALLTYACQVLVLTMAMAGVADRASRAVTTWAAGALIGVTLAWTFAHLLLSTRRRIPAFEVRLPGQTPSPSDALSGQPRAGAR